MKCWRCEGQKIVLAGLKPIRWVPCEVCNGTGQSDLSPRVVVRLPAKGQSFDPSKCRPVSFDELRDAAAAYYREAHGLLMEDAHCDHEHGICWCAYRAQAHELRELLECLGVEGLLA